MVVRGKVSFISALLVILAVLCISGGVVGINYALDSGVAWAQLCPWTDSNGDVYPTNDENVVIGGTDEASADIFMYHEGSAVFNEQGNDSDFRIAGLAFANLFCTDAYNKYVGIGTNAPQAQLHIIESGNTLVVPTDTIWLMQHSGSAGDSGYVGMVSGSTGHVGIWFGDETMPPDGYITYENDTDDLVLDATDDIVLDCDTIDLDGGQRIKRTTVDNANYTALVTDYYIGFINLTAAKTLTLQAAATVGEGTMYIVASESGSQTVTIDPNGAETIDGAATLVVSADNAKMIVCSGSEWFSL